MKPQPVSVLITWDVDPDRWATPEQRERALTMALDACEAYGVRSTFFVTASHAHEYPQHLRRMRDQGQEVGCHGLKHTDEEDYNRMPASLQREYIEQAARLLQNATGVTVASFRSPRVKTSGTTLQLLSECGYRVDSSVCSQRIDLISSNLINPGWITAPRRPYHPHPANAFRKGGLPILEVPVSAAVLPFISSSLKALGLEGMKSLFNLLYGEAKRTGKPVVYLAHPTEFIMTPAQRRRITLKDFSIRRIRTHGFSARSLLYRLEGEALYTATRALFAHMASMPSVSFVTCSEYECSAGEPAVISETYQA